MTAVDPAVSQVGQFELRGRIGEGSLSLRERDRVRGSDVVRSHLVFEAYCSEVFGTPHSLLDFETLQRWIGTTSSASHSLTLSLSQRERDPHPIRPVIPKCCTKLAM